VDAGFWIFPFYLNWYLFRISLFEFLLRSVENVPRPDYRSPTMIHENLSQSIENLSARMIAIRDSL
jgi:hypothetical protein